MRTTTSPSKSPRGWTLLELLIVVCMIAALVTISVPVFGYLRSRANFVACVSHLRSLHNCFLNYMQDHEMVWPQVPASAIGDSENEEKEWKWWHETLAPYGSNKALWLCPEDARSKAETYAEGSDFAGSYIPTEFDEVPNTA
ncbi:MAG: type II secretion system protein, partial [Roseimicrobium sp.]